MKQITKIAIAGLACLMLTACYSKPKLETVTRIYEVKDSAKMNAGIEKSFKDLGYSIADAKMEKTVSKTYGPDDTKDITIYKYGPAKKTGSERSCMKTVTTITRYVPQKTLHIVEVQSLNVTCYNSIGRMSVAVDGDRKTYDDFFARLSSNLGVQGQSFGM